MGQDHTHRQFDTDIERLRSAVTVMGGLVERQVTRAVDAVRLRDMGVAAQVLADEQRVNQLHLECDLRCNQTIARRQPIAIDLREIIAVLHINNDLERIGDESKKIARKARALQGRPRPIPTDRIARMADIAREMLRLAVDAFIRQDPRAAAALANRDDEVDRLRNELIEELTTVMGTTPQSVSAALELVFVVQSIERVGDHATNISEYVVSVVDGTDTRHSRTAAIG